MGFFCLWSGRLVSGNAPLHFFVAFVIRTEDQMLFQCMYVYCLVLLWYSELPNQKHSDRFILLLDGPLFPKFSFSSFPCLIWLILLCRGLFSSCSSLCYFLCASPSFFPRAAFCSFSLPPGFPHRCAAIHGYLWLCRTSLFSPTLQVLNPCPSIEVF